MVLDATFEPGTNPDADGAVELAFEARSRCDLEPIEPTVPAQPVTAAPRFTG